MALPSITDLKMWVGTLFTKDDWDYNFSKIVGWLSDGNGDLVVNSIKSTNGIDLDGAQISNVGAAETGSQAVNLDQALTLLNRTSYYYPFSVASGKVTNGAAAYLQKDGNTQVTVLAGNVNPDLVCVQSDGTVESVTSDTVLTVPSSNGTYHIIKEKDEPITITGGAVKVTISSTAPATPNVGDYWLDNSTVPFVGRKSDGGWTNEDTIKPFCYLGYVTVSSGTATVTTFNYNNNHFDVNIKSFDLLIPNYKDKINITMTAGNTYTATYPCVYVFNGYQANSWNGNRDGFLYLNNIKYGHVFAQDGYHQSVQIYLPLNKGDKIYWDHISNNIAYQYIVPLKGV